MKWFRSNIRRGSQVALFALAIQFVLSFGHFHGIAPVAATPSFQLSSQQLPAPGHDSDQPDDFCAICAVIALASTVVAAAPPVLPTPQAFEFSHPPIDVAFDHPRSARAAFQSRAPPIS